MTNFFENIIERTSTKKAALVLYCIIIFHIVFMMYLIESNRTAAQVENRSKLFQKITNVIYLAEATPIKSREAAINAIDDPDIHVALSAEPNSTDQFKATSFWKIIHALEKNTNAFSISIQLRNQQWLNIKAKYYSRVFLNQLFLIIIEIVVFGAVLLALWSINRFTKPLKKIQLSAEQLGINLEKLPLDVRGPKVVQEISHALNQMQDRIFQLVRNRTQLLAAISHDLRTPIMRARLRAQFIESSEYKEKLLDDLTEMENMISETLAFALAESQHEDQSHIDLVSLLESICNDAVDMNQDVIFRANTHRLAFVGRPIALKRALTNIINNAVRYGDGAVVRLVKRSKIIIITVEDHGPGIPESELEKVFEPFYRGEYSRSRDTGGVGLGLAVTRGIVLAHQGKIKLKNKKSGGLKVLVEFLVSL
ncbi:MAG: Sensor protein [uncultured bacterium]|nr:MAG: Sensor protein [uncultured bacterium]OGT32565.1 MAG: hypothetical protein A3C44_02355 [Gammaproteobacteria bacterium RIFCSPHIGHO2_02_FULL_39_13]OGT48375.1 MAG: hypothetical protein A3E53_06050 [Gammaproteobacteria bacterium RIFCSPHIGHO2_12_FULL_39_24]